MHVDHCWHHGGKSGALRVVGCCGCHGVLVEPDEIPREEKTHGGPAVFDAWARAVALVWYAQAPPPTAGAITTMHALRATREALRSLVAAWDAGWDCSAHPGHLAVSDAVERARKDLGA